MSDKQKFRSGRGEIGFGVGDLIDVVEFFRVGEVSVAGDKTVAFIDVGKPPEPCDIAAGQFLAVTGDGIARKTDEIAGAGSPG